MGQNRREQSVRTVVGRERALSGYLRLGGCMVHQDQSDADVSGVTPARTVSRAMGQLSNETDHTTPFRVERHGRSRRGLRLDPSR